MIYLSASILSSLYVRYATKTVNSRFVRFIVPAMIFCLLAGLRDYSVGVDVNVYGLNAFNSADGNSYWEYSQSFYGNNLGVGFALLTWLTSNIFRSEQVYFAAIQLMTFAPFYLSLRWVEPDNKWIGVGAYGLLIFPLSLCLMRQMIAVSIMCLSYSFIREKRWAWWSVTVILATLFHPSSLIGAFVAPIYLLIERGCQKDKRGEIIVCSSIVAAVALLTATFVLCHVQILSIAQLIKPSYTLDQLSYDEPDFFGAVLLIVIPATGCLIGQLMEKKQDDCRVDALCLLTVVISGGILMELSMVASGLSRLGYYGLCFAPMCCCVGLNKRLSINASAVLALGIVAFYFLTIIVQQSGRVFPYVFI